MTDVLRSWPWWVLLPGAAALGVAMFIVAAALAQAASILARQAWRGCLRLSSALSRMLVQAVIAFWAGVTLLESAGLLLWWPVASLWARTGERLGAALAGVVEAARQRQQLRQLWRREFSDRFATFEAFLDAFENGGKERQEPGFEEGSDRGSEERAHGGDDNARRPPPPDPPRDDPYQAACRLFGLPETGFTLAALNARYRTLISATHPDRGGSTARAAVIKEPVAQI